MKKEIIILIFCMFLVNGYDWVEESYATDLYEDTTAEGLFLNATQGGVLEPGSVITNTWLLNWEILALIVVFISLAIVALTLIIAKTLNISILKAWADVELSQIIVSGIILVIIVVGLGLLDIGSELLVESVSENVAVSCPDGQQKAICLANLYLDDTFDTANGAAKNLMKETLEIGRRASLKQGKALQTLPYMASSGSTDAGLKLMVERNSILMDYYGNTLASLKAQKYFLNAIGFTIGPLFIVFGLIFRSFFLTRKLGGLLIAIGIGVIVVLPLTYVFAMLTLSIQVYGDQMLDPVGGDCPEECLKQYPIGFNASAPSDNSTINPSEFSPYLPNGTTFYDYLPNDTIWDEISTNYSLVLCDSVCEGCSLGCRELPLTASLCSCNESACNDCPEECKVKRLRTDCYESNSTYHCPTSLCADECKMNLTPALENCWTSECEDCSADCRFNYADGTDRTETHPHCNPACDGCGCNVILPSPHEIDCDSCGDIYWERTNLGSLSTSGTCPAGCLGYLPNTTAGSGCEACSDCDYGCRFIDPDLRDPDCNFTGCEDCPTDCMINELPISLCQGCFECYYDCTTLPAIRTDCAEACGEIKGYYNLRPKDLLNKIEGADGETNTKALGVLLFPAFVLPLLSIILTIAFIRGFSQYLGGDYEIPGLGKLI